MASDIAVGGEFEALTGGLETPSEVGKETEVEEEVVDEESDVNDSEPEEVEEEETEEEIEEEEEVDEDEEKELDSDTIYQKLKAYDPKLLKAIPELRQIIFRERALTEVFPTVEDAKEAQEVTQVFAQFQNDLVNGDSSSLLKAIEQTGKKNLENFAANLLPSLQSHDKTLYMEMLAPEFKKLFRAAVASGKEEYAIAARNLNHLVFGDTDVAKDEGLKPKAKDEKEDAYTKRERELAEREYNYFANDIRAGLGKSMSKVVSASLEKVGLNTFVRKVAEEKIIAKIEEHLMADKRHRGNIDGLWNQAKRAGFTPEWKDRIKSAYLSRAKGYLVQARKEVLAEADKKDSSKPKSKQPVRIAGGINKAPVGKVNYKDIAWSETYTEADYLAGKTPPLKVRK